MPVPAPPPPLLCCLAAPFPQATGLQGEAQLTSSLMSAQKTEPPMAGDSDALLHALVDWGGDGGSRCPRVGGCISGEEGTIRGGCCLSSASQLLCWLLLYGSAAGEGGRLAHTGRGCEAWHFFVGEVGTRCCCCW